VKEEDAIKVLQEEIRAKKPKDMAGAMATISDGIAHGKAMPLHESKKIEKQQSYLRRADGSYDFLADESEMLEYEQAVIDGSLAMGLPTGMNGLNTHWLFKKNHICFIAGADNSGKSSFAWYLAVMAAVLHGWKIVIQSAENSDGAVRRKLKEFYLGKSLKVADDEELGMAHEFIHNHFRIISSKQFHTMEDFLVKCELIYDEGWEYQVVLADPYNSFDMPMNVERYSYTIHALNLLRKFKEEYSSVWICDHITSNSARTRDKDGYPLPPHKSDVEAGVMKCNKADDFIILHRLISHPEKRNDTQIHVSKIKDCDTGGFPTDKDNPVIIQMTYDRCGYLCNGVDPIFEYWRKLGRA